MIKQMLFLNSLLFIGLLCSIPPIYSIPIEVIPSQGIVYPIHVACECNYNLYVDGKKINPADIVRNWDETEDDINATNIFNPVLFEPSPKIIAFNNIDTEYPGFMNGFVMDMNNGKDYTKHIDWKCKYFDPKISSVVPSNWMNYDYDDSEWEMAVSYGMNYQNNSYQIFWHERDGIHLNAEWLWTSENANPNIYCRKKRVDNEPYYVETKPVTTSAPSQTIHVGLDKTTLSPMHTTSASIPVEPHKPVVSPTATPVAPHKPVVSSTPTHVEPHKPVVSSTPSPVAPHKPVVTSTPSPVAPHKPVVTSTPTPVAPHKPVVTSTPTPVAPHKPVVSSSPTPVAAHKPVVTSTPSPVAPHKPVVSSTPTHVEPHKPVVSSTPSPVAPHKPVVTTTPSPVAPHKPVVTSTPSPVAPHKPVVSPTPSPVAPHKPVVTPTSTPVAPHKPIVSPTPVVIPTPAKSKNNIIIYQHITYVIQKFKYTQKHSYSHIENLIRNLKYINKNHDLYKNLIYTRNHLLHHYNTMFKELYRLRKKYNDNNYDNFPYNDDDDDDNKIPPFIQSMKILDKYIQEIEKNIQFIKGKYKYTLMNILAKLKLQYREDTVRLIHYWRNSNNNR